MKNKKYLLILIILSIILFPLMPKAEGNQVIVKIQPPEIGENVGKVYSYTYTNSILYYDDYLNGYYYFFDLAMDLYNNTDDVVVFDTTKIKSNKDYTLKVRLTPSGNEPIVKNVTFLLEDYQKSDFFVSISEPVITDNYYEVTLNYNTTTEKNKIYTPIDCSKFKPLQVGQKVNYNEINSTDKNKKHYTVNQGWYEQGSNNKLTEDYTFEKDKIYEYHLQLTPKDNYSFSDYISFDTNYFNFSSYYVSSNEVEFNNNKIEYIFTYNTTQDENIIYGPIKLDIPEIAIGKEIKKIVSNDSRYTINGYWYYYDEYYHEVEEGEVFEYDHTYYYNLSIQPNDGYIIDYNLSFTTDTVLNNNVSFQDYQSNNATITASFNRNNIYSIYNLNTYEVSPKVNQRPQELRLYSYSGGSETGYEISSQEWYFNNSLMNENSIFIKNKEYTFRVKYTTKENYRFNDSIQGNVPQWYGCDYYQGYNIISFNPTELVVEYYFDTTSNPNYIYDPIKINTKAPVIGEHPTYASILSTEYWKKSEVWYNITDHVKMTSNDVFERNKMYTYNITLTTSKGKHFSSEFEITSDLELSNYFDKNQRIQSLIAGGGRGSTTDEELFGYGADFIVSDYINDDNVIIGEISADTIIPLPKTGYHVSYETSTDNSYYYNRLKELNLTIEKGWYEKDGDGRVLTENDIFQPNKTYEFRLRFIPINGKRMIKGLITDYNSEFNNNNHSIYFSGINRVSTNNYFDIIYNFKMKSVNYDGDESIVKSIDLGELNTPKIGDSISYKNFDNNPKYTITEVWAEGSYYYETQPPLTTNDIFNDNSSYVHHFKIVLNEGYTFGDDFHINYNASNISSKSEYSYSQNNTTIYILTIGYYLYSQFENNGFIEFNNTPYNYYSNQNFLIPKDLDVLNLEVYKKSGEFDISFSNNQNEPYDIDYEINNNSVIISGLSEFFANNKETNTIQMIVKVDANNVYEEITKYYGIQIQPEDNQLKNVVLPNITDYEGYYDGAYHSITVEGGSGGTIMYSLNQNNWQEELPQVKDIGTTKIYVKIVPDEGYISMQPTFGLVKIYKEKELRKITFNSNDENNQIKVQSFLEGETTNLSKNTFIRNGYTFEKWTTNPDGTGISYTDEQEVTINNNLTLYAQWKKVINSNADIYYSTHVQSYGWQDYVADGAMSGTSGQAKRLEAIKIKLNEKYNGSVEYRTHVQTYGWQDFVANDNMSGTSGEAKRLEAIEIKLSGEVANNFDIYYRVHAQTYGWLGWAKNGESAGTAGYAKRLEGIEIKLVPKDQEFPTYGEKEAFKRKYIEYQTHVQTYGWQDLVADGAMSGTSGEAKRLEGIKIVLSNPPYSGSVKYRTHVQTYGWQFFVSNGTMSGTSGEAKRLEAIEIKLTGEMAEHYDIYYRVHAQTFGWLAWAKNGEKSGTAGLAKRLEGIEIVLVDKDESPPQRDNSNSNLPFINNN